MTEQYTQTVEVSVPPRVKARQWIGIFAVLFSLGFLMLTIFLKWYFVFGFLVIFAAGAVYLHLYNTAAKEYTYDFSTQRLVITKKDLLGKQSRILCLIYEDVQSFGIMEGIADDEDTAACNAVNEMGVYQMIYGEDGKIRRLLFEPDDYMIALLTQVFENIRNRRAAADEENIQAHIEHTPSLNKDGTSDNVNQ